MIVILGKTENNSTLHLGDAERRNGLYILGKPRMGKSWLMVNLAVQDAEAGHGVFFLDPHGEAAEEVLHQIRPDYRENKNVRYMLFDPTDKNFSFGINPLACNIDNQLHRDYAFARTKGIFDKLWKKTFEERPWLQLILQNAIYAFIETKATTIADLPMFFRDRTFREYICSNMKYNVAVRDYWLKTFASKSKRDQDSQMEAAQTRCEIMLGHPVIRHVLGQSYPEIWFRAFVNFPLVMLIKLPHTLPSEVTKILGTILVSEFKHAIETRKPGKCHYSVFIDEFQNFVSFEDMSALITQAPKFGVATTLAHHDRFGQLADNKEIIGATSAIANKVIFQAEEPTFETRFEDQLVISPNPFWDLLNGHNNPGIRNFVEKYLLPIKERLEDLHGEARAESLMRMEYLDTATLYRLDERMEGVNISSPSAVVQRGLLHGAGKAIQKARSQTEKLQILNEESQTLRRLIRSLNKLFISVMEGKISPYSRDFRKALVEQAKYFDLIDILEPLYQIHLLIMRGESCLADMINPRSAGRFDYRTNKDSEIKHPEVTRKYSLHEEGHVFERTLYDFITDLGETDIERMETLTKKRFQEALQIHKKPVPVTRAPYAQRWNALHHNIKTILEPLCDLKAFCVLLQRPENHLKVRSRQQVEKRIPIRTVADMSNEMVQELTEMPKYTAMVKILQGKGVWKGKLNTLPLPHLPISKECREGKDGLIMLWNILQGWAEDIMENNFCKRRSEIDLEIKERQDGWQLKTGGEQPVVRDKSEKGPAGPPYKPVIEPDEPPPPIRPKKPRS